MALADKALYEGNRVELSKRIVRLEEAEKELKKLTAIKRVNGINGRIASMWKSLESLLFTMSQVDKKYTMDDYWKMNVYTFMRYKQLLIEYNKPKKGKDDE